MIGWRTWTRRGVQLAALALFLWLFRRSASPAGDEGYTALSGVEWWFRVDPLAQLSAAVADRSWTWLRWPFVVLIVLGIATGRAFCGWLCPLGTLLDLWGHLTGGVRRLLWGGREAPEWAKLPRLAVLLSLVLAALGGVQMVGLVDPFSLLVRGCAALDPWLRLGADSASTAALGTRLEPASEAVYGTLLPWLAPRPAIPGLWWASLGLLAMAGALELLGRRGWCRWACPLGAFYGLLGRWTPLLRLPSRVCPGCGDCRKTCNLAAFDHEGRLHRSDCTLCLRCLDGCTPARARFDLRRPRPPADIPDPGRRAVLIGGAVLAAAPLASATGALTQREPPHDLLRPPGVGDDEGRFLSRCVRCGTCLAACPEGALHADGWSVGLDGLLAPALIPRRGGCAPGCTRCGEVCPTAAIPRLTIADKPRHPIGLAVVDHDRCIPYAGEKSCLVCEEHCPVPDKAIQLKDGPHGEKAPVVIADRCTGCGLCEQVCPLDGASAIRVLRLPQA